MPDPERRPDSQRREEPEGDPVLVSMARYSGYGLQLAASVGLFMWAGWWLDGRLGSTPLFTVLGALGGGAAGFYSLYLHLVKRRGPEDEKR